jgi:hypothetical protein
MDIYSTQDYLEAQGIPGLSSIEASRSLAGCQPAGGASTTAGGSGRRVRADVQTFHREQELLLLVAAALGSDAGAFDPIRGKSGAVPGQRRSEEFS